MRIRRSVYGMARIGWVPANSNKTIEVYVWTNDPGRTPHFHVRKYGKNNRSEWEVCILYESCDYFMHGKYKGKLSSRQIAKELDRMLRQIDPNSRNSETYWQTAISEWNRNNSKVVLDLNLEQPDYTKLETESR